MSDAERRQSESGVDRGRSTALHQQLSESLRAVIDAQVADTKLPSEEELVATYDVSRATVRRALQTLVDEGVLIRRQGKGTFVAPAAVVQSLDSLQPFVQSLPENGEFDRRLIDLRWLASDDVPPELGGANATALGFRRLYLIDSQPRALGDVVVAEAFGNRINRADLEANAIYHVLRELGVVLHHADFTFAAESADDLAAESLEVAPGSPLLKLRRVSYDVNGDAVEVTTHRLLPEVHRLRLTVEADSLPTLFGDPRLWPSLARA